MSQLHPCCPADTNENNTVNNDIYFSILALPCNDALLWVSKPDQCPPAKLGEIRQFEPQRMMGIFGAFVSNDRAAEWVEGEQTG